MREIPPHVFIYIKKKLSIHKQACQVKDTFITLSINKSISKS